MLIMIIESRDNMKKVKLILTSLIVGLFFISDASAKILYSAVSDGNSLTKNPSGTVGYYVDNYACYSCRPDARASIEDKSGIGVFFKNNDEWQLGSFGRDNSNGLSAFFTVFKANSGTENYLEKDGNFSGGLHKKDDSEDVHVYLTPEIYEEDSNFILLKYKVQNLSPSDAATVNVATFNDIYLGKVPDSSSTGPCDDNASFTNINKNSLYTY